MDSLTDDVVAAPAQRPTGRGHHRSRADDTPAITVTASATVVHAVRELSQHNIKRRRWSMTTGSSWGSSAARTC
jgi:hypothetical protein